jgi:light-regulated signal transduction histidine kinase (bacteriophytochrome)
MNNSFIASLNGTVQPARTGLDASSSAFCKDGLTDLNRLVQQVFEEQQQKVSQLQTIIRCDVLPLVQGGVHCFLALFRNTVGEVLEHPPRNSKLFIYIKCERKATEVIDLTMPDGFIQYEIRFYTNSNNSPEWEKANINTLALCEQLSTESKGVLEFPAARNAGYLFTLNLPGKIN